jgi:hypothetical protein
MMLKAILLLGIGLIVGSGVAFIFAALKINNMVTQLRHLREDLTLIRGKAHFLGEALKDTGAKLDTVTENIMEMDNGRT